MIKKIMLLASLLLIPVILSSAGLDEVQNEAKRYLKDNPDDGKAIFNLGFVLYKNKKYAEASKKFKDSYAVAKKDSLKSANCYNLGNSFFMQKKIKESLKWYKRGLIYNQHDADLRYNYTVVKMISEAKKKNKDDSKKQKQNNKDKQDKKKGDKKKQKQNNKDQQKQNKGDKKKDSKESLKKGEMSKEDAKRILKALKEAEKKAFKVRKGLIRGAKNEKDW